MTDEKCDHKDFHTIHDVGWDIDEEGEERQHLDACRKCHATRFRMEHTKHGLSLGPWMENQKSPI